MDLLKSGISSDVLFIDSKSLDSATSFQGFNVIFRSSLLIADGPRRISTIDDLSDAAFTTSLDAEAMIYQLFLKQ